MKKIVKQPIKRNFTKVIFGRTFIFAVLILLQLACWAFIATGIIVSTQFLYAFFVVLSIIFGIVVINRNDNQTAITMWLFLILGFPLFGIGIYLYTRNTPQATKIKRAYKKELKRTCSSLKENEMLLSYLKENDGYMYNISRYIYRYSSTPVDKNSDFKFLESGPIFWEEAKKDMLCAKEFIFVEFFLLHYGGVMSGELLDILEKKAKEGVEVRLIYDGSCMIGGCAPNDLPEILSEKGIKCQVFSPLRPAFTTYQNNRDHRKIMVIDGKIAYTGGANISDEYLCMFEQYGKWKDCCAKISGKSVNSFTLLFLQTWNARLKEEKKDDYNAYYKNYKEKENGYMVGYGDLPFFKEPVAENVFLYIIENAKKYIYISTPYLIPSYEMRRALSFAAKRGVDVKIIMPHIPDKRPVFCLGRSYYKELIESGVKIYEFEPGFVHSKIFISDDICTTLGTINLDFRSLFLHLECGVFIYKNSNIKDVKSYYEKMLKDSFLADMDFLDSLPKRYLLWGQFLRLIAPLL